MIYGWVRRPPNGPNKYIVLHFYHYGRSERGLGSRKARLSSPHPHSQHTHTNTHTHTHTHTHKHMRASRVIHYWPFRDGNFIVVVFVQCYVVFHFLMLFCSFQLTDHVVAATDHFSDHNWPFTDQGLFIDDLIAISDRCTMHQLRTNYGLFTDHGLLTDQLALKFTIFCN